MDIEPPVLHVNQGEKKFLPKDYGKISAGTIANYRESSGPEKKTVSAQPFPTIHSHATLSRTRK